MGTSPSESEAGDVRWEPAHPFLKQVRKVGTSPSVLVCLDALRGAFKASARPGRTQAPDTGLRLRPVGSFAKRESDSARELKARRTGGGQCWWSQRVAPQGRRGLRSTSVERRRSDPGHKRHSTRDTESAPAAPQSTDTACTQTVAHHAQQREVCTVTREYTHTCSQRTFKFHHHPGHQPCVVNAATPDTKDTAHGTPRARLLHHKARTLRVLTHSLTQESAPHAVHSTRARVTRHFNSACAQPSWSFASGWQVRVEFTLVRSLVRPLRRPSHGTMTSSTPSFSSYDLFLCCSTQPCPHNVVVLW